MHQFIITYDFLKIKKNIEYFKKEIQCNIKSFILGNNVTLQNKMWDKYRYEYMFLQFCLKNSYNIYSTIDHIIKVMDFIIDNPLFNNVLKDVKKFKKELLTEWSSKKDHILKIVKDITKIDIFQSMTYILYITSEKLNVGKNISKYYFKKNVFIYSHKNLCDNYNMSYIIHEALHSVFGSIEIEHAIIELISDNELRIRLNNMDNNYFEYGHNYLRPILIKLLPYWKKYLQSNENIYNFRDRMIKTNKLT